MTTCLIARSRTARGVPEDGERRERSIYPRSGAHERKLRPYSFWPGSPMGQHDLYVSAASAKHYVVFAFSQFEPLRLGL
jgi:hypothetical protein